MIAIFQFPRSQSKKELLNTPTNFVSNFINKTLQKRRVFSQVIASESTSFSWVEIWTTAQDLIGNPGLWCASLTLSDRDDLTLSLTLSYWNLWYVGEWRPSCYNLNSEVDAPTLCWLSVWVSSPVPCVCQSLSVSVIACALCVSVWYWQWHTQTHSHSDVHSDTDTHDTVTQWHTHSHTHSDVSESHTHSQWVTHSVSLTDLGQVQTRPVTWVVSWLTKSSKQNTDIRLFLISYS